jgi:hypothetical protein
MPAEMQAKGLAPDEPARRTVAVEAHVIFDSQLAVDVKLGS